MGALGGSIKPKLERCGVAAGQVGPQAMRFRVRGERLPVIGCAQASSNGPEV